MICAKCGKEVGPLFCGKCRIQVRREAEVEAPRDIKVVIPLLAFDPIEKMYRFGCTVVGCPLNCGNGWCSIKLPNFEHIRFHPFDGDNCVTQFCG